jgi:hypothetical protein
LLYFQKRNVSQHHSSFTLGDVFLGHVGIGRALRLLVKQATEKFQWFQTFEANATFHLGDEQFWRNYKKSFGAKNRNNLNFFLRELNSGKQNSQKKLAKKQ